MKKVISVRFKENGKSYYFDPAGAEIKTGDHVIVFCLNKRVIKEVEQLFQVKAGFL